MSYGLCAHRMKENNEVRPKIAHGEIARSQLNIIWHNTRPHVIGWSIVLLQARPLDNEHVCFMKHVAEACFKRASASSFCFNGNTYGLSTIGKPKSINVNTKSKRKPKCWTNLQYRWFLYWYWLAIKLTNINILQRHSGAPSQGGPGEPLPPHSKQWGAR
jgi:hypothetical protein